MRYLLLEFTIAFVRITFAQFEDLPQCSYQCFVSALGSDGCADLADFDCHCKKVDTLLASVIPCIQGVCTAAEQDAAELGLEKTCAKAGVSVNIGTQSATSQAISATLEVRTNSSTVSVTTKITARSSQRVSTTAGQLPTGARTTSSSNTLSSPLGTSESAGSNGKNGDGGGDGKASIGAIVGGVVGGLAVLCIAGVAVFYIKRRHPSVEENLVTNIPPRYNIIDVPELVQKRTS